MTFVIFTAPLTEDTYHIFNLDCLKYLKPRIKLINVGRGPLIQEKALIAGLQKDLISCAALDVFEVEPFNLDEHKELLSFKERLILSSHNGSNTEQAVERVSKICISRLRNF